MQEKVGKAVLKQKSLQGGQKNNLWSSYFTIHPHTQIFSPFVFNCQDFSKDSCYKPLSSAVSQFQAHGF